MSILYYNHFTPNQLEECEFREIFDGKPLHLHGILYHLAYFEVAPYKDESHRRDTYIVLVAAHKKRIALFSASTEDILLLRGYFGRLCILLLSPKHSQNLALDEKSGTFYGIDGNLELLCHANFRQHPITLELTRLSTQTKIQLGIQGLLGNYCNSLLCHPPNF